mgnify:CR=1 FL=1
MDMTSTLHSRATNQQNELAGWRGGICGKCGAVCEDQQLGREALHDCAGAFTGNNCGECYVCHIRQVARELWRVLRDDGCFFIVLGDSYFHASPSGPQGKQGQRASRIFTAEGAGGLRKTGGQLKPKDLVGIPWRTALALQQDGWTLRCDIIWSKQNCMPESVQDRPTRSHEYLFLFSKGQRYYYDAQAIAEDITTAPNAQSRGPKHTPDRGPRDGGNDGLYATAMAMRSGEHQTRNARSVWTIPTEPFAGAHFATFPQALVERCIRAGTSEAGCCPACKTPWVRHTERTAIALRPQSDSIRGHSPSTHRASGKQPQRGAMAVQVSTTGFAPACHCPLAAPVPCVVADIFVGSGTVPLVARALGRHSVGLDLSFPYLQREARKRLGFTDLATWEGKPQQVPETLVEDLPPFYKESLL